MPLTLALQRFAIAQLSCTALVLCALGAYGYPSLLFGPTASHSLYRDYAQLGCSLMCSVY